MYPRNDHIATRQNVQYATTILQYKVAKVKTRPIGACINILWHVVKSIKAYREKLYGAISKRFIVWLYRADGRE